MYCNLYDRYLYIFNTYMEQKNVNGIIQISLQFRNKMYLKQTEVTFFFKLSLDKGITAQKLFKVFFL